jgi:hypothetical protein
MIEIYCIKLGNKLKQYVALHHKNIAMRARLKVHAKYGQNPAVNGATTSFTKIGVISTEKVSNWELARIWAGNVQNMIFTKFSVILSWR